MDNKAELFPVVDSEGHVTGSITRGEAHNGSHILHPVVHLHVYNSRGELYLQHRPAWKDIQPDKWDTAVGGHVAYGETIEQALQRETREELGLTLCGDDKLVPRFLTRYVFNSDRESELVHVYRLTYDGKVRPDDDELDGGRFWTADEIDNALGTGVFTPNFEHEYQEKLRTEN